MPLSRLEASGERIRRSKSRKLLERLLRMAKAQQKFSGYFRFEEGLPYPFLSTDLPEESDRAWRGFDFAVQRRVAEIPTGKIQRTVDQC